MLIDKYGSLIKTLHWMVFASFFVATPTHAGIPLPEFYGVYIRTGELIELKPVPVITRFGLIVGGNSDRGMAVDGFEGDPWVTLKSAQPEFIVYTRGLSPDSIHLAKLGYTSKLQAYQFNITGTKRSFFRNVYGKGYQDTVLVDLWRPSQEIALRIAPVDGRQDMYRLVPAKELSVGRYAIYFGESLHASQSVFIASVDRRTSAYYFSNEADFQGDLSAAASEPESLDADQIREHLIGNTLENTVKNSGTIIETWAYYNPNGEVSAMRLKPDGTRKFPIKGKWWIDDHRLCVEYKSVNYTVCSNIRMRSNKLYDAESRASWGVIVKGNPRGL